LSSRVEERYFVKSIISSRNRDNPSSVGNYLGRSKRSSQLLGSQTAVCWGPIRRRGRVGDVKRRIDVRRSRDIKVVNWRSKGSEHKKGKKERTKSTTTSFHGFKTMRNWWYSGGTKYRVVVQRWYKIQVLSEY